MPGSPECHYPIKTRRLCRFPVCEGIPAGSIWSLEWIRMGQSSRSCSEDPSQRTCHEKKAFISENIAFKVSNFSRVSFQNRNFILGIFIVYSGQPRLAALHHVTLAGMLSQNTQPFGYIFIKLVHIERNQVGFFFLQLFQK